MSEESLKKDENNKVIRPPKEWPNRLKATLFVLVLTAVVAAIIVILKNDLVHKKIAETENYVLDFIGAQGFGVQDIVITGRGRTTLKELENAIGLKRGDNILKVDVKRLKRDLENLPWVRDVAVSRSLMPNILKIEIQEKKVLAIWQLNERFYPLDMDGYVIEADYRPDKPILLVVGAGAAENITAFLAKIKDIDKKYLPRIKVANYISKRRWNIILDDIRDGITIKLPEEDVEGAWKKLLKLDVSKGILKRKLTIIDLRLKDKVTVKLRKTKVKQRMPEHKI